MWEEGEKAVTRPKRTGKDRNHAPIRDELRAAGFVVLDVADLPGDPEHNPLDLIVMRADASRTAVPTQVGHVAPGGVDMSKRKSKNEPKVVTLEISPDDFALLDRHVRFCAATADFNYMTIADKVAFLVWKGIVGESGKGGHERT